MLPTARDSDRFSEQSLQITGNPPTRAPGDRKLTGLIMALRRHPLLVVLCVLLSLAGVATYTVLAVPVYEATSIVRIEEDQVSLPQLPALATETRIGTEVEVLRGRSAAVAVIDSLGLRARLRTSVFDSLHALVRLRRPQRPQVSSLFSVLRVPAQTDTMGLVVRAKDDGVFAVGRPQGNGDSVLARVGDTVEVAGVTLALSPAALGASELHLDVVSLDDAVRRFGAALEVSQPVRDADLIAIRVRLPDPVRAADAANLLAQNLIAGRQVVQQARAGSVVGFLRQQLDTLDRRLQEAEYALRAYRTREGLVDVAEQARTGIGGLARLQAERSAVRAERDALAATLEQMRAEPVDSSTAGFPRARRLISFPSLLRLQAASQLLGALAQVENQRALLLMHRTPDDPAVRALSERIREFDLQFQTIAEDYVRGLTNTANELDREARRNRSELDQLPEREVRAARLERQVEMQQELSALVQTRLKEAEIALAMNAPTVQIVDVATIPTRPWWPRPKTNLALGLVFGTLLGAGVAVSRERADRSIRSRADAMLTTGLPVLGAIPRAQEDFTRSLLRLPWRRPHVTTPVLEWPHAAAGAVGPWRGRAAASVAERLVSRRGSSVAYAEAFNQLYANLALGYREQRLKLVVFTSPLPGEGKTLSTINFALTLAARGMRTLLIDGDLRRGLVSEVFGCDGQPGFAEVLSGSARFRQSPWRVQVGERGQLVILPAGVRLPTPGRGLEIERVREVLETFAPQFDLVLVDTPPVNVLADAAVFGAVADAVVLVLRAGRTDVEAVHYAMDQLSAARAPVAGTLLNDIDRRHYAGDGSYRYMAEVERYYAGRV